MKVSNIGSTNDSTIETNRLIFPTERFEVNSQDTCCDQTIESATIYKRIKGACYLQYDNNKFNILNNY
jgi:hypothetical protein